mgnify:FL=1
MVWLFGFLVLTRLTFTVFSVPWSALIAELSEDYAERTIISSYRILVGSLLGGLSTVLIWRFWFTATEQFPQGQLDPDNYGFFGLLIGGLMTLWSLISTHFTRREIPYLLQPTQNTRPNFSAMLLLILAALQSRNYQIVLVSILIYFGILGTLGQFDMYINTYFWRLTGEQIGTIGLFGILAPIFAFLSAPLLQRNFQKHHLLCFALIVQMLLSMAVVAFRLSGLFPSNESVWFLPLLGSFSAVGVFLSVVGAIMVFSMTADLADEQEYRFKTRQEGVLASGIAFSTKAVGSAGVVVSGFLLEFFIGFPVGQSAGGIEEDVLFRLAITDAVIVNSFVLIPAFLITRYDLTRESMAAIQSELKSLRPG